jgi:hypothetical protein
MRTEQHMAKGLGFSFRRLWDPTMHLLINNRSSAVVPHFMVTGKPENWPLWMEAM